MDLPLVENASEWASRENVRLAVEYFMAQIERDVEMVNLSQAPLATLENHRDISVRFVSHVPGACGVSGYYRPNPPTINVRRANSVERDNFTVLHELGHHLQQSDPAWAFEVLSALDDHARDRLEEAVSDALATNILLPDSVLEAHFGDDELRASAIADLHASTVASRRACCMAAFTWTADKALIFLTDLEGKVEFCLSTHESLYPVPWGGVQPDVARMIRNTASTIPGAAGNAQEGLTYSTGNRRDDIRLDLAFDHQSRWVFVVARPTTRFGDQQWSKKTRECSNNSCGTIFDVDATTQSCPKCHDYKCPECSECSCESDLPFCSECWTQLSTADFATGRDRHAFHDE